MANQYWDNRMADTQYKLTSKNIKVTERKLADLYHSSAVKLKGDFTAVYNKLLQTMAAGQDPTPADLYKLQKYWELQTQLTGVTDELAAKQIKIIEKLLKANYGDIYSSINFDNLPLFGTLTDEGITQAVNSIWCADSLSWSQRVWGNTAKLKETLLEQLAYVVSTGKSPEDLNKYLQDKFDVSFRAADTIIRTEMAHIQTTAAQQRYKDYGIQYVQVLAEDAGCKHCEDLAKKKYPVNGKMPIPAHPNCRCCIVPVVD